jgi:hypothetical protein
MNMELSITSVTSRKSSKATRRALGPLFPMKSEFQELIPQKKPTWCLMATLVEEESSYLKKAPNTDGIYQAEVGYGNQFNFSPNEDHELTKSLFEAIVRVIESYPFFSSDEESAICQWVMKWRKNISGESTS